MQIMMNTNDKRKMCLCFMCMIDLNYIDCMTFILDIYFTLILLSGMILANYRYFQAKKAKLDNFAHYSEFGA